MRLSFTAKSAIFGPFKSSLDMSASKPLNAMPTCWPRTSKLSFATCGGRKPPCGKQQIGIFIDSGLCRQAKALAILQGRKAADIIDDALREFLAKQKTCRLL